MYKKKHTFFTLAALFITLLFSCKSNRDQENIRYKSIQFSKEDLRYNFTSQSTIFGLGDPFDFAFYYDQRTNSEYIYQLKGMSENEVSVLKFELDHLNATSVLIDTIYLEQFSVQPKTHSLWLFISEENVLGVIKKDVLNHGTVHLDSIFYYQGHDFMGKFPLKLMEVENQVASYSSRFNKIISNRFLEKYVPVYQYHVPFDSKLEIPRLIDVKEQKGMWFLKEKFEELTKEQYYLLEAPFIIYQSDRISKLNPGTGTIDVFYPDEEHIESVEIPNVPFKYLISDNASLYKKVLEEESDYWYDFMYNPYRKQYYLFQHISQKHNENRSSEDFKGPDCMWGRILMLDENYNYIGDTVINSANEIKTIIHPKFPTLDGYWTIEIDSVINQSTETIFNVSFQKMVLHEK
ncbi:MAG: hypothetical protein ACPG21_01700 [Crocinitomicaceae bacterium]